MLNKTSNSKVPLAIFVLRSDIQIWGKKLKEIASIHVNYKWVKIKIYIFLTLIIKDTKHTRTYEL